MISTKVLGLLSRPSPVRLTAEEWATIVGSAVVIREDDTGVAGKLRVLDLDGAFYVQEQTPDRAVLLRPRPNLEEAMAFVDGRLQIYERMWDG